MERTRIISVFSGSLEWIISVLIMRISYFLMVLLLAAGLFSCSDEAKPYDTLDKDVDKSQTIETKEDTAYVDFELKELELVVKLTMTAVDSWVVSPLEGDFQYGGCSIELHSREHLEFEGELTELPESVEVYDELLERSVRRIQVSTTFRRGLRVLTEKDFESRGSIFFVLEPKCVPYQCFFVINQEDGKLSVQADEVKDLR